MARKNVVVHQLEQAKSLATSFTTEPTLVKYLDNVAYQINVTTSDSTGSFSVEASVDYAISEPTNLVTNPGNWVALPLGGTPSVAGANDSILVNLNQLPFNAVRVTYTPTVAGTGTCDVIIQCRQLGG